MGARIDRRISELLFMATYSQSEYNGVTYYGIKIKNQHHLMISEFQRKMDDNCRNSKGYQTNIISKQKNSF